MVEQDKTLERLTALEVKIEFIKEALKEIKDEVKEQPSIEDYEKLEERAINLEKSYTSLAVKVAGITSAIAIIIQIALHFLKG